MVDPYHDPYGRALDDLAGNEGVAFVNACQDIGERMEEEFDGTDVLNPECLEDTRKRFEALVEKAFDAFDAYETKLQAIEEVFHARNRY